MKKAILEKIRPGEAYGIVPARSGSKGVKNKNIKCLCGYPMMAFSIAAGKLCSEISRVIVSTDSEYYAKIANYYGGETPFLRPAELAVDTSTDLEFMEHAINWLYENEGTVPEYFVHLRPTYPLRDIDVMSAAVTRMKSDNGATSLRSAHLAPDTPYKWFNMRSDGYFKSILGTATMDQANNPRQSFPAVYIPDGYVDLLRTSFIVENDLMHGDRVIGYVVPDGVDVDSQRDFSRVESFLGDHRLSLLDYLKENYKTLEELDL